MKRVDGKQYTINYLNVATLLKKDEYLSSKKQWCFVFFGHSLGWKKNDFLQCWCGIFKYKERI